MSKRFPAATSAEVIRILKKAGFLFKRQSGTSHAIYYRESDRKRTNVPVHAGKVIKRRTLKAILSAAGITMGEFEELRRK
ncbi:MAG: type II toxin-antitoxin system HicA family toxin [Deltaproteobacteria bacterium]|nr:type II toxin-antitoxin system HicA family toxin [Deltaproteobacteria bacterium]